MKKMILPVNLIFGIALFAASAISAQTTVKSVVDWQKFLAKQDLVWNSLPKNWDDGAFIGNGLLGAMIYSDGTNTLQWDVGRSDVTDNGDRVAIGKFVLVSRSKISGGAMRLDLWNAEARGDLKTAGGEIHWRSFTHAKDLVSVIELNSATGDLPKIIFWLA